MSSSVSEHGPMRAAAAIFGSHEEYQRAHGHVAGLGSIEAGIESRNFPTREPPTLGLLIMGYNEYFSCSSRFLAKLSVPCSQDHSPWNCV